MNPVDCKKSGLSLTKDWHAQDTSWHKPSFPDPGRSCGARRPGRPDYSRHTSTKDPVSHAFRSAAEDRCGRAHHRWWAPSHRSWKGRGRRRCGPPSRCGRRLFEDSRRWRARTAARGHAPAYVRALASTRPARALLSSCRAPRPDLTITKPAACFSACLQVRQMAQEPPTRRSCPAQYGSRITLQGRWLRNHRRGGPARPSTARGSPCVAACRPGCAGRRRCGTRRDRASCTSRGGRRIR